MIIRKLKRKIILFIAVSLDGKIARSDGDVSWLNALENTEGTDHGYMEFYQQIDTTLMGHNTYKMIKGFGGNFPYPDKTNYVFTRQTERMDTEHVAFVTEEIPGFVKNLRKTKGKDIWLVGGAQLNATFLDNDLIDEIMLFVMPMVIGEGIPLFANEHTLKTFKLQTTKTYSTGAVLLQYSKA